MSIDIERTTYWPDIRCKEWCEWCHSDPTPWTVDVDLSLPPWAARVYVSTKTIVYGLAAYSFVTQKAASFGNN